MNTGSTLRLILGDQLNIRHHWFTQVRSDVIYTLMEVRQETDTVEQHIQKVVGFFSAMRHFGQALSRIGHRVIYIRLDDPQNEQHFEGNLKKLVRRQDVTRFEYMLPDDYRLDRELENVAARLPVPASAVDTEHFLSAREDVGRFFSGKKRYLMESFYRHMRRRYDVLMDDAKPLGGKWNFDHSNRNRYNGAVPLPRPAFFENDVADIVEMVDRCGVPTFGEIDPQRFIWPVTRRQAQHQLNRFLAERLAHFGTYQDAMTTESGTLFHALLSFALNTKMIGPGEVIRSAVSAFHAPGRIPVEIAQVEGFVRQILGWREYIRGIYWAQMPDYATLNFFGHTRPLPSMYWTARTDMRCMRTVVAQSLKYAYAHHIQRLMVTGNFALLAGIHPDAVDAWYLGIYIDAVHWVEHVNTRGMSQFADGGLVATKPYVSSANYIHKMSDYCDACDFDWRQAVGGRACPFNCLYWSFVHRHRKRLAANPRMAIIYRTWDRMKRDRRRQLLAQAQCILDRLDHL